jgi:hypothetical protein
MSTLKLFITLLMAGVISAASAWAMDIEPGHFYCQNRDQLGQPPIWDKGEGDPPPGAGPTASKLRGRCEYQATGLVSLTTLVNRASLVARPVHSFNDELPIQPVSSLKRVTWWFTDSDSNQRIGAVLQDADQLPKIPGTLRLLLNVSVYSFQDGADKEIGFKLGGFLGKKDVKDEFERATTSIAGRFFSGIFKFGNLFASALDASIYGAWKKSYQSSLWSASFSCENDGSCENSAGKIHFRDSPVSQPIQQRVGLSAELRRMRIINHKTFEVQIDGLDLTYSYLTGEKESPVFEYKPAGGTLSLRPNQIYFLGSQTQELRVVDRELTAKAKEHLQNNMVVVLRTSIVFPGEKGANDQVFELGNMTDDRTWTKDELDAFDKAEAESPEKAPSLADILQSLDVGCKQNIMLTTRSDRLCGFYFTKLSRQHFHTPLKFKTEGKLRYASDADHSWELSEVFVDHGVYQLPELSEDGEYVLRIELERGARGRAAQRGEPVGALVPFSYISDLTRAVSFEPSAIQLVYEKSGAPKEKQPADNKKGGLLGALKKVF